MNVIVLSCANEIWLLVASWLCVVTYYQGVRILGVISRIGDHPAFFTILFRQKKWMWFRNVSQSWAIHPGITESQLTVLTAMPWFGDPLPFLFLPLSPSDKIWMSESRNTNKSHCPLLCPWITGFLLHIFGDFISKAVWISLVGEISPIWPGAWCARLIPDRAPPGTHVDADSIFAARKSDEYRSHCDAIAHWWVEVGRRRSSSQSVSRRQPRVIMLTSPRAEVRVTQAMHLIGPLTKISHLQAYFPKAT